MAKKATYPKQIETITHEARRTNIPTAEYQSVMKQEEQAPVRVSYDGIPTSILSSSGEANMTAMIR